MIYFDNTATSWPKPREVAAAMTRCLEAQGGNPGRSGHRMSVSAGRVVYAARETLAELFNVADPLRIVFTHNATEALNLALGGLLRAGDHVITGSMEHNSMMRPIRALEQRGVEVTVVRCAGDGTLDPARLEQAIRANTVLIALNHASNVIGTVLPVGRAGRIARRHDLLLLVDAAQTAGCWPIDLQADEVDLLAFTGHKSLCGPTGTGGLIIGERVDPARLEPLTRGGTGSRSEHEVQPDFLPDRYESGTPNTVGLAGLQAGVRWLLDRGVEAVRAGESDLVQRLIDGLREIDRVTVYGCGDGQRQTPTVSFAVAGMDPAAVGLGLDERHDVMCRVGLHCAPQAHRTIGTFPHGTVRFGLGIFNTAAEVDTVLCAVARLAREA